MLEVNAEIFEHSSADIFWVQESRLGEMCVGIIKEKAQLWQGNYYGYGLGGVGIFITENG